MVLFQCRKKTVVISFPSSYNMTERQVTYRRIKGMTDNDGDPVRTEFTFHPIGSEHYTREEKTISVYWMYSYREDFGGQVG